MRPIPPRADPAARPPAWFGAIFMALGIGMFIMFRADPDGARAPGFVLDAAAGAFLCAGLSVVAHGVGQAWLGRLSGLLLVYLMAVPGLWMLLGEDAGSCSVDVAVGVARAGSTADAGMCRLVFGAGGVIVLGLALGMTLWSFRRGPRPDPGA